MSGVTVAMLLAVRITDNALTKVGKYQLTSQEKQILSDAGFDSRDIESVNNDIELIKFIKRKEFIKYKNKLPKNIEDIIELNNYVRSKILKKVYKTENVK